MRDTRTLGLPPEPKADAQPLSHPGAPRSFMFNVIFDMVRFSSRLFFLRERERERAHVQARVRGGVEGGNFQQIPR